MVMITSPNREAPLPQEFVQAYTELVERVRTCTDGVNIPISVAPEVKTNLERMGFKLTPELDRQCFTVEFPRSLQELVGNYKSFTEELVRAGTLQSDEIVHPLWITTDNGQTSSLNLATGKSLHNDLLVGTIERHFESPVWSHTFWQTKRAHGQLPIEPGSHALAAFPLHEFVHVAVAMNPIAMRGYTEGYAKLNRFMGDYPYPHDIESAQYLEDRVKGRGIREIKDATFIRTDYIEEDLVLPNFSTPAGQQVIELAHHYGLIGSYDEIRKKLSRMNPELKIRIKEEFSLLINESDDQLLLAYGARRLDRPPTYSHADCLQSCVHGLRLYSAEASDHDLAYIAAAFTNAASLNIHFETILCEGLNPFMARDTKTANYFRRSLPKDSSLRSAFNGVHPLCGKLLERWYSARGSSAGT